jgi:RNA polymerase sigma-70 factor (ECF subfamily)
MGVQSRLSDQSRSDTLNEARARSIVQNHYALAWRLVRRLGVPSADAEDAVQQVFVVVARRLGEISPGKERAFVTQTSVRVAADVRRSARRRPLELLPFLDEFRDAAAQPDELVDHRRARGFLDSLLERMPEDVRAVFVLFEIEELTFTEIADVLAIPRGTVASRLARGRTWFATELERHDQEASGKGERP